MYFFLDVCPIDKKKHSGYGLIFFLDAICFFLTPDSIVKKKNNGHYIFFLDELFFFLTHSGGVTPHDPNIIRANFSGIGGGAGTPRPSPPMHALEILAPLPPHAPPQNISPPLPLYWGGPPLLS